MRKLPGLVVVVALMDIAVGLVEVLRGVGLAGSALVDGSVFGIFGGVIQIAIALVLALLALGLIARSKWARRIRLGWAALAVVGNVLGAFGCGVALAGWLAVVFNAFVVAYLGFSSDVRRAFSAS